MKFLKLFPARLPACAPLADPHSCIAHRAIIGLDLPNQQEAESAVAHAVAKLRREIFRVQRKAAIQCFQHGEGVGQFFLRGQGIRQADGMVTQRCRVLALESLRS